MKSAVWRQVAAGLWLEEQTLQLAVETNSAPKMALMFAVTPIARK
jgi:hypothetical protein